MIDITEFLQTQDDIWHTKRFIKSLEWLEFIKSGDSVLEMGGKSAFTKMLKATFPETEFNVTGQQDLRYALENQSERYDVITCMEVIEHLSDQASTDIGTISTFKFTGIKSMLSECARMLRPDGRLFLTTPNVCSYNSLYAMLNMRHPFSYLPHTRELAPQDLVFLLGQAGLQVERLETVEVWDYMQIGPEKVQLVHDLLVSANMPTSERGDNIFVIAKRRS